MSRRERARQRLHARLTMARAKSNDTRTSTASIGFEAKLWLPEEAIACASPADRRAVVADFAAAQIERRLNP